MLSKQNSCMPITSWKLSVQNSLIEWNWFQAADPFSWSNLISMGIKVGLALLSSYTSDGIDKSDAISPSQVKFISSFMQRNWKPKIHAHTTPKIVKSNDLCIPAITKDKDRVTVINWLKFPVPRKDVYSKTSNLSLLWKCTKAMWAETVSPLGFPTFLSM